MVESTDQKVERIDRTLKGILDRLGLVETWVSSSKRKIADLSNETETMKYTDSEQDNAKNSESQNKELPQHFRKELDIYGNSVYCIARGRESLNARYLPRGSSNFLEITYKNLEGDSESRLFLSRGKGIEEYVYCLSNGTVPAGHIKGYEEAFKELGPMLRKNIPPEWTKHLGDLFLPDEQRNEQQSK